MEALENALLETKLRMKNKIEQLTMEIHDNEAKSMNMVKPDTELQRLIDESNKPIVLRNTREARIKIAEIFGQMKSLVIETDQAKKAL